MDAAEEVVDELTRGIDEGVVTLESWWADVTGSSDGGNECAYYFKEGDEGDYNYISWDGFRPSTECAIGYDEFGNEDWTDYNNYFGLNLLQNDPKLKIQNLSIVDFKEWSKVSVMNLRSVEKTSVTVLKA